MKMNVLPSFAAAAALAALIAPVAAEERPSPGIEHTDVVPRGPGHAGMPVPPHDRGPAGLALAARLSALETFIGITPDQAPVWRAYTDAVLAFARDGRPGRDGHADVGPPPAPGFGGAGRPQMLLAERLAESAIARGQNARALKTAANALRETLSPAQLARLIEADTLPPPPTTGRPVPLLPRGPKAN